MSTDHVNLLGTRRAVQRVEVAPGVKIARQVSDHAPQFGLIRLQRNPDGTLTPMLSTWKRHVRLTRDLGERLGLDLPYETIRFLIRAGFVRAKQLAPRTTVVEVESLHRHLVECEDPEFWTGENLERWKAAEAEGK